MQTISQFDRSPRLSELKVSYRRRVRGGAGVSVRPLTPKTAESYLRAIWSNDTIDLVEDFVVVCLTSALQPLGWVRVSRGGFDAAMIDPRVVFGIALQTASAAILVAHNHPSGLLVPSEQDVTTTRRLKDGARLLGIRVVDHIILSREGMFSFADGGLL